MSAHIGMITVGVRQMFNDAQRTGGTLALIAALLLLSRAAPASAADSDDWPGFRGKNVDGISTESGIFDHADGFSLRVAWKQPLGRGYSGVSIVEGIAVR